MSPLRIAYLIGTRPEIIRTAPILRHCAQQPDLDVVLVNTGQHYDHNMLQSFFDELHVHFPCLDLHIGHADPAAQVAGVVSSLAPLLSKVRPHVLCVYGDTNSSLGGALAAGKTDTPLVHIEAGCRSFDMDMPEEFNRRLIDHGSGLLLPVSEVGRENLLSEQVPGRIQAVGDPQFDIFLTRPPGSDEVDRSHLHGLVTLHRPSNVDDPDTLLAIVGQLETASRDTGLSWVFPIHPRTRQRLGAVPSCIEVSDPLPYGTLVDLLESSVVCVTDSGGLQKEALWTATPCVTVRSSTEWIETIQQGVNVLAPPGTNIAAEVVAALDPDRPRDYSNPYGDGHASEYVVSAVRDWVHMGAAFDSPYPKT